MNNIQLFNTGIATIIVKCIALIGCLLSASVHAGQFVDDFNYDSISSYTKYDTDTSGGVGQFIHDSSTLQARIIAGDNVGLGFSHVLPLSNTWDMQLNFSPAIKYPLGGAFTLRLLQDANNYYEVFNTDGYGAGFVRKIVNGVEVGRTNILGEYSQNKNYPITVSLNAGTLSVSAFGENLILSGEATELQIGSFDIELYQQDSFIDNINFVGDGGFPPTADAGDDQTVTEGDTVYLDGAGSFDTDGNLDTYQWLQTGGTPSVTLDDDTAQQPSFTAPAVSGSNEVFTFELTVTDNTGLSNTDLVNIVVRAAGSSNTFVDYFDVNSTGEYSIYDTATSGGFGSFIYDSLGGRGKFLTGDNVGLGISHSLPASTSGTMQLEYLPTVKYPVGGAFTLRMVQDANNYYEISSTDGYNPGIIRKVVNGVETGIVFFQTGYSQNQSYAITLTFASGVLSAYAFGEILTLTGDAAPLLIGSFEVEFYQQDAYIDNITFTTDGSYPPTADAGDDQTATEGDTVDLDGAGSFDTDGNIDTYRWLQTGGVPSVALDDDTAQQPSFIAPAVSGSSEAFTFELTVVDDDGLINSDLVKITVNSDAGQSPTANAGLDQTANGGDHVVLDGTGSFDPDGNIISYLWVQTAIIPDTPIVILDDETLQSPSFNAPSITGVSKLLTFDLMVTDNNGLTAIDQVIITLLPSGIVFLDDFSADTTGDYSTTDTVTDGGFGRFVHDAASGRARINTGDNVGLRISRAIPVSDTGVLQLDFLPTVKYPVGGAITVRLLQDSNNYYELSSTDGYDPGIIRKVVNGSEVGRMLFQNGYNQNVQYQIILTFSPDILSADAFGQGLDLTGNTTPLLISGVDIELYQQDAFIDNIALTGDASFPPTADAGPNQAVLEGENVQLNGSNSLDVDGNIVSYLWGQTSGPPTVTLDDDTLQQPAFIAPVVGSTSEVFTFALTVTDNDGLMNSDQVSITVLPASASTIFDDFSSDSISNYTTFDTWTTGGFGQYFHDSDTMRGRVITGDNVGMQVSQLLPLALSGSFQLDFHPTASYPLGSVFALRLMQDADNYYEFVNTDGYGPGYISKVVGGVEVDNSPFVAGFNQNINYHIFVTFSPTGTTIEAFGQTISLTGGDSSEIAVTNYQIDITQQDAYIDNIAYPNPLGFTYYLAIGDSITAGVNDDIGSDGLGYPPILENLLTQSLGALNIVMNEGISSDTSLDGLLALPGILAQHPGADYVLVQYGTNDAFNEIPSGTYKNYMQQIINLIVGNGKTPYLAKLPPMLPPYDVSTFNPIIQQYNLVIDELIAENAIGVTPPPDMYCHFDANPGQLTDSLHPNGVGYQAMADLWLDALLELGAGCTP